MPRALILTLHTLIFVVCPISNAQSASSQEEVTAALKEFHSLYKHRNLHVRKAAVEELINLDHYEIMETLLKVLKDPESAVRETAVIGLGRQRSTEAVARMIQKVWRGRNKTVRLAILKAFRDSRPQVAFTAIQELTENKDWQIRAAATELVGFYPDNEEGLSLGTVVPRLEDKEPLVRLAALLAMKQLGNRRGNKHAIAMLKEKDWRLRAAAISAMLTFRQKSAIQALIDQMRKEDGRLQDDCSEALEKLTGSEWGVNPDKWQKWWNRNKSHFKVPSIRELKERKKKAEAPTGYARPKPEYPPYHGIKTRSRRMLFVLDVSTSMIEKVTLDARNPKYIEEFDRRYGGTRIKIDIAREELINVIAGLKPYVRFNIVLFNSKIKRWQKGLVAASGSNRNRAIKYLARLKVSTLVPTGGRGRTSTIPGQTNTFEALNAIFNLTKEKDLTKKGYKTEADTAFLLSDGNPTTGRIVQPKTLLEYFATINKRAKVVIHTISFGNANRNLMEPLARQTGGQYVVIGN